MRTERREPADQGFTLVEVIVAIVLLAMVSVGMLGLFIRAMKDSSGLARRQVAVSVASQSLELARSVPALRDAAGNSKLIGGRTQADVDTQWAAVGATADLSGTDKTWDTTATAASVPALPFTTTTTVSGITYTSTNLIGTCWRPATGGTCVRAAAKAASSVLMYRVLVLVTWTEGAKTTSCSGSACSYALASLVDPGTDPSFNVNATNATWPAAPVVTALTVSTPFNTPVTVDVATVTSGATPQTASVGTAGQGATASALPNTTRIIVTPAAGFWSGSDITVPFTVTDPYGQSATNTLTVHVTPPAGPTAGAGTAATTRNRAVTVTLSGFVSGGTGTLTYATTTGPVNGSVGGVSGAQVTYSPRNGWIGTDTFTYRVADTYGHTSSATVTVTVS